MSREIKFRGLCLKTGKLVYGQLIKDDERAFILSGDIEVHVDDKEVWGDLIEVSESTIGQSTTLRDRSGVEFYEGDVVAHDSDRSCLGIIEHLNSRFQIKWKGDCFFDSFLPLFLGEIIIIGNIHENPELMVEAENE